MGTLHFRSPLLPSSPRLSLSLLQWLGPCPPDFPASSPYSSCFLSSLLPKLEIWRTQNNLWAFIIPFLNFRIKWERLDARFPPNPKMTYISFWFCFHNDRETAPLGGFG